jgi:hypothetical protein
VIERVKENYNFSNWDEKLLVNLAPTMEEAADDFVDAFYKKIMQFKNATKYLKDEKIIERHKGAVRAWFLKIFQGQYDDDYLHYLEGIGYTHVKTKLPTYRLYPGSWQSSRHQSRHPDQFIHRGRKKHLLYLKKSGRKTHNLCRAFLLRLESCAYGWSRTAGTYGAGAFCL